MSMTVHPLPAPRTLGRATRAPIIPSGVMGMLIFVVTEIMLFAGFVSAFTIMRTSALVWPPPGQPRLPVAETAFNTALLLASGVTLVVAGRAFRRNAPKALGPLLATILLGGAFVGLQGREWIGLIGEGMTLTSSALGSFFFLIVGAHALHAVIALCLLVYAASRLRRGFLPVGVMGAAEIFWYFVVLVWPFLYWRVYL
jgi:heme/copper-type cytochrome/quinol oxidase subunit 3